jgi:hypothetical protein
MWFWYARNARKNGGKQPFLAAIYSVVFGMALFMRLSPNGRQNAP